MEKLFIFADIETDGLRAGTLLQIAAITADGSSEFNVYINPKHELPLSCTNLCGLYYFKKQLYREGVPLPSVEIKVALTRFKNWLESFNKPITLIFHNGFSFDCYVLARYLLKFNIETKIDQVSDTLPCFRKTLKSEEIENHKLATLASFFELEFESAHDALQDTRMLKAVVEKLVEKSEKDLRSLLDPHTREFQFYTNKEKERNTTKKL